MKIALSTDSFRAHVSIIATETQNYFETCPDFKANSGVVDISGRLAELLIYTASHCLQGEEIRSRFTDRTAKLYHDLDMGFSPINFSLHWVPLPWNTARDKAQKEVAEMYMKVIRERRANGDDDVRTDMTSHLMNSTYKDGTPVPDHEVAHMMIALLMAGQHSSSATSCWIILRLAQYPHIAEELYQEQIRVLGADLPPLTYENLAKLHLNQSIIKETLRLHAPIHSIMRKVKNPMQVPGTGYVIPEGHVAMAAPCVTMTDPAYFPNPNEWDPHRWDKDSPNAPTMVRNETEEEKIDYGYGLVSKGAHSPYLPFGAGRHRCIGEQFANVQLQALVAEMVRIFKFRTVDGTASIAPTNYNSLFSRPADQAMIYYERR